MPDSHFVAVLTYGTEKQHGVSNFKIGRGAGADVLLALFGDRAQETTPPQASYRYVHVDGPRLTAHRNYIILRVTPDEKAQIEAICRKQGSFPWVYLWENQRWLEFPCAPQAHYIDPSSYGGSCPKSPPTAARFVTPSQAASEAPEVRSVANGLTITQSGGWWWIGGDTYAHREDLKVAGARWSSKRRQWYYAGATLPAAVQVLVESHPAADVRASLPDTLTAAIPHMPLEPPSTTTPTVLTVLPPTPRPNVELRPVAILDESGGIPQNYIGRVNVVGDCYCFGVVVDRRPPTYKSIPIYLSVAGPATSVEALWAKLSQGKETSIVPDDNEGKAIYLEPNKGGLYVRCQKKLDALGIDHLILVHTDMAEPRYPVVGDDQEPATTYLLCTSDSQRCAKLGEHVRKTVKVAVFEDWFPYLYREGRTRGLVRNCIGYGIEGVAITLNAPKWTEIIRDGLHTAKLTFTAG